MTNPVMKIRFHAHHFALELTCGMTIAYPLDWFPSLADASIKDLKNYKIKDGKILWPTLRFKIAIEELIQKYWDYNFHKNDVEKMAGKYDN